MVVDTSALLAILLAEEDAEIYASALESVTHGQAMASIKAYGRFGRGRNHPARLNYGDCFSYSLALELGLPLLYKGEDFCHTDVPSALS